MGEYHNIAEYNPVHKVMLFGGGNGPNGREIFSMDASGQISALRDAPFPLGIMQSVVTVDTASGDYLVFGNDRTFYSYDIVTDAWRQHNASNVPIFTTAYGAPVFGIVATPISNHGVNFFVQCNGKNDCRVFLYKHAPGSGATFPQSPESLTTR
jgi:hypothetical protein